MSKSTELPLERRRKPSHRSAEGQPAPTRRGRPTKSRVAEIDSDILAVARTLFLDIGYAATSMEAVAAKAMVSKSTLYARYPVKEDLFRAIVADRLDVWAATAPAAARAVGDVRNLLRAQGLEFFAAMRNPEIAAFDRLILREADQFPEIAEAFHRLGYLRGISDLAGAIRRHASTESPQIDEEGVARVFTSALLGWWRSEGLRGAVSTADAETFLDRLIMLLVDGAAAW